MTNVEIKSWLDSLIPEAPGMRGYYRNEIVEKLEALEAAFVAAQQRVLDFLAALDDLVKHPDSLVSLAKVEFADTALREILPEGDS